VLQALGLSRREAEGSLRLSLGRDTTATDIHGAIEVLTTAIKTLT
jgi:cysteine desulfurase